MSSSNSQKPTITPIIPPPEELIEDKVIYAQKFHPKFLSNPMMEYLGHAFFIVIALIVIDFLQYSKPPSTRVGHHFNSTNDSPHLQDVQIIRRLKNKFL